MRKRETKPGDGSGARRVRARGMTLLEVVLAAALLAAVGGTVTGVLAQISRAESQRRHRLHAYEVANRLLLQYVDDYEQMPPVRQAYDDGVYKFRWTLDEVPLEVQEPANATVVLPERKEARNMLSQTVVLDVRVYEAFDDGVGGWAFGAELARLTRPYNPMPLASLNPDSMARTLTQTSRLNEMVRALTGDGRRAPRVERAPGAPQRPGASGATGATGATGRGK